MLKDENSSEKSGRNLGLMDKHATDGNTVVVDNGYKNPNEYEGSPRAV